ncbi:unnamed protein product [Fraxinus pennsylvanica]|uniref:Pentatricopeptide repeat-containing protein n=1 Tax=Fraxinus pennsylvanica TaxID=56036 RepID=A0AAD1Z3R2_9LAMI|nr:unnamed protein product [Fraxinus pennsylvanica]
MAALGVGRNYFFNCWTWVEVALAWRNGRDGIAGIGIFWRLGMGEASIGVFCIYACIYVCVLPGAAEMVSRTAQRCKLSPIFIHLKSKSPTQFETPTPHQKFKTDCKIDTNDALTCFYNMLRMKPSPPIWSFNKLLGSVAKTKNYQDVIFMYQRMVEVDVLPDISTINVLLNCYCCLNRVDIGLAVMSGVFKRGYNPTIFTFNSLFKGLCRSGNSEVALRMLEEVENGKGMSDFRPNLICYNTLIDGLCKEGLLNKGKQLFLQMKDGGIMPDLVTYSGLIRGFCKGNEIDDARELFVSMEVKGYKPDVVSYTVLINGYCKYQKLEEAMRLFEEMICKEYKPNVITFNTLLIGLFQVGKVEDAQELFAKMKVHEVTPDSATYDILLDSFFKNNCLAQAMELFHTLERFGLNLRINTYNCILDGLCKARKLDLASELFGKLSHKGLEPTDFTYNIMIDGFSKFGNGK